jgi:hypothetical protein
MSGKLVKIRLLKTSQTYPQDVVEFGLFDHLAGVWIENWYGNE